MARKTKAEALATRHAILDAAESVFEEEGIPNATLSKIAANAGVTRGAIYWHFENKEELIGAMIDRAELPLDDLRQADQRAASGDALAELRATADRCLQRLAEDTHYQRVCRILLHGLIRLGKNQVLIHYEEQLLADIRQTVEALFTKAHNQGRMPLHLSPQVATWSYLAYMRGIHREWLYDPSQIDVAKDKEQILDIFFRGLQYQS